MANRHGRWWWLHLVIFFSLPFRCASWADPLSCSLFVPSNPLLSSNSLILTLKLQLYGCFGPTFAFLHLNIFPISDDLLFYVPLIFFLISVACKFFVKPLLVSMIDSIVYSWIAEYFLVFQKTKNNMEKKSYKMYRNIFSKFLLSLKDLKNYWI